MTAATAATVTEALTGVNGLGTVTIAKVLTAHELESTTAATPEQLARVADAAAGKKDGLKGLALAEWIVTGNGAKAQGDAARAKRELASAGKPAAKSGKKNTGATSEFTWPKKPAEILLDYLKAEVTADASAPNKGAPFIDAKGILRFTGTHWRTWLAKQGMHPGKNEAGKPVRDAGMKMRPFALPGENRQMGFYTGPAPRGTSSLPKRIVERATRSTSSTPRKPADPFSKFTDEQMEYLRTVIERGKKGEVKDSLLDLLPPAEPTADEPPLDDDSGALTQREREALETSTDGTDAPQEPAK